MSPYTRKIRPADGKALLARSGNKCAFPGCEHPIFNDKNTFVAQVCHIEAVSPGGPRYNDKLTDEEVNSADNLMLMCYRHHKETDDVKEYSVGRLKDMKWAHESQFKEGGYNVDDETLNAFLEEVNRYWKEVDKAAEEHIYPEMKVEIDTTASVEELLDQIREHLGSLQEANRLFMPDLKREYFEFVCLMIPNLLTRAAVLLDQLEIKIAELQVGNNPKDDQLRKRIERLREEFKRTAKEAGLND